MKFDGMIEQNAQAIDYGEAEAEAALGIAAGKPVEFVKDIAPLILWNPGAAVPYFDAQCLAATAAADHDAAGCGIAHRIGHEIKHNPLQQNHVAAHPGAARYQLERQSFFPRRLDEVALDPLEQLRDRKFHDLSAQHTGVEFRDV